MKQRTTFGSVVAAALGVAWGVVALAPLYFLVLGSLRSESSYLTANPWLPAGSVTLENYSVAMTGVGVAFRNSIIVTVAVCALVIILAVPAAFAIVRGRGAGLRAVYWLLLAGLAIPVEGVIVAIFVLVVRLHLYDSLAGIILPTTAFNLAISVLILVAFLRDIPKSLFEAMDLEGAGRLRVLRSLVYPMARPPLLGLGLFVTLGSWNSLLLPLVTTTSQSESVLPVALLRLQGSDTANYPAILASVVVSALPIMILYIIGRRQLIGGLTLGMGGFGR